MATLKSSTKVFIVALLLASQATNARINEPSSVSTQDVQNDRIDKRIGRRRRRRNRNEEQQQQQQQRQANTEVNLPVVEEDIIDISRQTMERDEMIDSWRQETAGGGRDYSTNIVGGKRTKSKRYPYFVSLFTKIEGSNYHVCGGTLIHDDMVLTAAHCATHADFVRIGAYAPPSNANNGEQIYHDSRVARKIEHPEFFRDSRDRLHNDFMLLKLAKPVKDSRLLKYKMNLNRVKKADRKLESGDSVTAIGLGRVENRGSVSKFLREVELKFRTNEQCSLYFGELTNDQICAKDNAEDACEGDSGGPLIVKGDTPEEDVQVGIVSWGSGCASNFPGVYSRVSEAKNWIDNMICAASSVKPAKCRSRSASEGGCMDESFCSEGHILPKEVYCFLNGNSCPTLCGKCENI